MIDQIPYQERLIYFFWIMSCLIIGSFSAFAWWYKNRECKKLNLTMLALAKLQDIGVEPSVPIANFATRAQMKTKDIIKEFLKICREDEVPYSRGDIMVQLVVNDLKKLFIRSKISFVIGMLEKIKTSGEIQKGYQIGFLKPYVLADLILDQEFDFGILATKKWIVHTDDVLPDFNREHQILDMIRQLENFIFPFAVSEQSRVEEKHREVTKEFVSWYQNFCRGSREEKDEMVNALVPGTAV